MLKTVIRLGLIFVLFGCASGTQAASPSLSIVLPRGVQRGTEQELVFYGGRLADAQEIFFYDRGFEVVQLEPSDSTVKARVKIAPDCRLGEHVAQIRTASGISEYRSFYVGPFPAVAETEPNSQFDAPQAVPLNSTVNGVVDSEDVDYYLVDAKKGQRISVDVYAMRLGAALFDPYVAILDERRFELAASDDSPLCFQDAIASTVAPDDGKYIIEMRESAYGGSGDSRYLLHISSAPSASAVYPAGGKLGEVTSVTFLGDPAGKLDAQITAPAEVLPNFNVHAEDTNGIAPTGNPFRLFRHGNVLEQEPNNDLQSASPAELPLALNGIIQAEGDIDHFKFAAKQGQVFEVECYSRRIRSRLDPVVSLFYADGRGVTGVDDSRGPDSYFRFQVPEDGEYILQISDFLKRGGEDFVYRIEFQPIEASLTLSIPRVALYSQYRQTIYVPRGNRFATLINASRNNFGGDLILEGQELPPGVTMIADPMPAALSQMPVVFEAAADAPSGGKLVDFTARHADASTSIRGRFTNLADMIIGEPGQSLYWHTDVDRLAFAVVDELPFHLDIVQPKAPLVRDGSMQLKIVVRRKEGFNNAINVEFPFRPPGVGAASSITIPEGQSEGLYPLNADGGAQEGNWPVYAIGSADVNGTAWVASQLARLPIAAQPVSLAMERASCEQGQEAQIYCKLTHNTPFEGAAKIRLIGLPPKVETNELEFNKDTQELVFKLKTTAESPVGQHKNIFCEVVIMQEGEPIALRAGLTELQIDAPLPAAQAEPQPMPQPEQVAAAPAQPMEKPLSRLEKLRLEAQKRAEQEKGGTSE